MLKNLISFLLKILFYKKLFENFNIIKPHEWTYDSHFSLNMNYLLKDYKDRGESTAQII